MPTPAISANWNAVDSVKVEEIGLDSKRTPAPASTKGRIDPDPLMKRMIGVTPISPMFSCTLPSFGVPPGSVGLADQREMPVADLPPGQIRVPDKTEIQFLDVMVSQTSGDLHAELICGGEA